MIAQIVQKLFGSPQAGGAAGVVFGGAIPTAEGGDFAAMLDAPRADQAGLGMPADIGAHFAGVLPKLQDNTAENTGEQLQLAADDALLAGLMGGAVFGADAVKMASSQQLRSPAVDVTLNSASGPLSQVLPHAAPDMQTIYIDPSAGLDVAADQGPAQPAPDSQQMGMAAAADLPRALQGAALHSAASLPLAPAQHMAGLDQAAAAGAADPQLRAMPSPETGADLADNGVSKSGLLLLTQPMSDLRAAGIFKSGLPKAAVPKADIFGGDIGANSDAAGHLRGQIAPPSPAQLSLQAAAQRAILGAAQEGAAQADGGAPPPTARMAARAEEAAAALQTAPAAPPPQVPLAAMTAAAMTAAAMTAATPLVLGAAQAEHGDALGADGGVFTLSDPIMPQGFAGDGRMAGGFGTGAGLSAAMGQGFGPANTSAAAMSAQILPLAQAGQAGAVEITLSPMELGQLRFEMRQTGDQMQIVLSAERPETLDLLRRHSDALLQDFRAAGFAGASLSFGGWGAGRAPPPPPQFNPDGEEGARPTLGPVPSAGPSRAAAQGAPWRSAQDAHSALNLRL